MPTIAKMVGISVYPCFRFCFCPFELFVSLIAELRKPRALKPASTSAIKRPGRGEPNGVPVGDDFIVGGGFGVGVGVGGLGVGTGVGDLGVGGVGVNVGVGGTDVGVNVGVGGVDVNVGAGGTGVDVGVGVGVGGAGMCVGVSVGRWWPNSTILESPANSPTRTDLRESRHPDRYHSSVVTSGGTEGPYLPTFKSNQPGGSRSSVTV